MRRLINDVYVMFYVYHILQFLLSFIASRDCVSSQYDCGTKIYRNLHITGHRLTLLIRLIVLNVFVFSCFLCVFLWVLIIWLLLFIDDSSLDARIGTLNMWNYMTIWLAVYDVYSVLISVVIIKRFQLPVP